MKRIAKDRLVRGIAILFLLYTAVDLVFPQLCSEELVNLAAANNTLDSGASKADSSKQSIRLVTADDSQRNQPGKQQSQDEDCFCCCAHVVAGRVFAPPIIIQQKSVIALQEEFSPPRTEFETPYHPPRFS